MSMARDGFVWLSQPSKSSILSLQASDPWSYVRPQTVDTASSQRTWVLPSWSITLLPKTYADALVDPLEDSRKGSLNFDIFGLSVRFCFYSLDKLEDE